jgi:hypothetical protein
MCRKLNSICETELLFANGMTILFISDCKCRYTTIFFTLLLLISLIKLKICDQCCYLRSSPVTLSLFDLVTTALTKDATSSGRQELLLSVLGVCDFLSELLGGTSHGWPLSWVGVMSIDHHTL